MLVEKPLTAAATSTERLVRLARSRGLVLLENVAFPHHSQHAAVHLGPDNEIIGAVLRQQSRTDAVVSGRILAHTPCGVTIDLAFGMEHSYRSGYGVAGSSGHFLVDRAFTPAPVTV